MSPRARVLVLLAPLSLAACGEELSRTFGLTRDAPDEFRVTTRAPLSMPPDFALRAPRPGEARPQEQSQRRQAEATLAPGSELATGDVPVSAGQSALVAAAGGPAPSDIRARVDQDAALDTPGPSFTDRLMFWRSPLPPGTAVDPARESQRLRENAALGQSPDAGDTPIIQRKRPGLLGSLF